MRTYTIALLLAASVSSPKAADFAGLWFSCAPDRQAPDPFVLLEIKRAGAGYRWLAEWGSPYSANGTGSVVDGKLVLRGCKTNRGKAVDGCDTSKPPVFLSLKSSAFVSSKVPYVEAVRQSAWVRTDQGSWKSAAGQCDALRKSLTGSTSVKAR